MYNRASLTLPTHDRVVLADGYVGDDDSVLKPGKKGTVVKVDTDDRPYRVAVEGTSEETWYREGQLAAHRGFDVAKLVRAVAAARPEAARVSDGAGNLPLHGCVAGGSPLEVAAALLQAHPGACLERNGAGLLPLHLALSRGAGAAPVVEALLSACPEAAAQPGPSGALPLADALDAEPPSLEVIAALLIAHPPAAAQPSKQGVFPAAVALRRGLPHAVVERLLDACPGACGSADQTGRFLLHVAAEALPGAAAIFLRVLAANPAAASAATRDGETPLLVAASRGAPAEAMDALLAAWPAGLSSARDAMGRTLLHFVSTLPLGTVRRVLAASPASALERDRLGRAPLHVCWRKTAGFAVGDRVCLAPRHERVQGAAEGCLKGPGEWGSIVKVDTDERCVDLHL